MSRMESFYFHQRNVLSRLGAFRIIFSLIIVLTALNDRETLDFASYFEQSFQHSSVWYSGILSQWTFTIIALALLHMFGLFQEYVKWALAIVFIPFTYYFNFHLENVAPPIWSYSTTVPIFMFALLFSNNEAFSLDKKFRKKVKVESRDKDSFILRFIQICILSMFFQSAVSKMMISGWDWFLHSKIMHFHIALQGTAIGKTLLDNDFLITSIAFLTGLFEFLGFLIFFKSEKLYAFIALSFHIGAWIVLDINFFFLYPLYLPIFFEMDWLERSRATESI